MAEGLLCLHWRVSVFCCTCRSYMLRGVRDGLSEAFADSTVPILHVWSGDEWSVELVELAHSTFTVY